MNDPTGLYTERKSGPNDVTGKPWYTNIGIQIKAPQFTTVDVTDNSVTFKTYRTDSMEIIDEYTVIKTDVIEKPVVVAVNPSAYITKLNGNNNDLTITVIEELSDGTTNTVTQTFSIGNNAADIYIVGSYMVYVDTKGNDQIRDCRIAE